MNKSESIAAIAKAMAAAQREMQNPAFDSKNPHFKSNFASLASVREAVVPVLAKHGITVLQLLSSTERTVSCETVLAHESGEWISEKLDMPVNKLDAQAVGSASTYARRYALMAIACVVGEPDDDGNHATQNPPRREESKPTQDDINCQAFITSIGASADLDECRQITKEGVDWAKALGRADFATCIKQAGINKSESFPKVAA